MTLSAPRQPRLLPSILFGLLVSALLVLPVVWLGNEYRQWNAERDHAGTSFNRRLLLIDILSEMRAAETSQRGYVITGDHDFREEFDESHARVLGDFARAHAIYRDEPGGPARIANLGRIADGKFAEMEEVLRRYDAQGPDAARRRIADGEGKRLMTLLRGEMDGIIAQEQQIGEARIASYRQRSVMLQAILWSVVIFASLALGITLLALWRQRRTRYDFELVAYDAAKRNDIILNSTVDPIIIVNPSGTIETVNSAVTRILGYEAAHLVRRDFDVLSDIAPGAGSFHERIGLVDGELRRAFWTDRQIRHSAGRWLPFDIALGVMELPDGDHIVVSLRDISERKRIDRLKDELISTVSHELRTPLTSIVGALGLLRLDRDRALSDEAASLVAIAENNAQRLIRLINDMLDVDRIDSGKMRLIMQPIDARNVVMRACEDNISLARASGIELQCTVPDEPMTIQADDERLIQVITNLLSNAIKASSTGGHVMIGATRSANSRRVTIHVDDEGPGIPAEFRSRIFGRFERAIDDEGSAGTGLGLAIAREIVQQHGGDIWFEDRPEGGTRFAFSLAVSSPAATSRQLGSEPRILICESNPATARLLQSQIAQEGYGCRIVGTAQAARKALEADGYSMLLLDMAMDDEDAFGLAREVRHTQSPDHLSILMVSAEGGDDVSPLPLDLVDWISKPIDPTRLKTAIGAALRNSGLDRPTVLHLDDDQDTLDITASAMRDDAHILKATSLREAREILRFETPHLAILDVHLAGSTGLDLLPDLVDEAGVAIPTIIYSAHDVDIEIAGQIDAVLVKSRTSLPDLKATIRRVVATRHAKGPE